MSPQQPTDAPAPAIASSTLASHQPPVFNILVAGQSRIGKTGLIRLLLDTSCLSSTSSLPRIACLAEFASYAGACPTTAISCATADIPAMDQRPEFVLNMVDTPGLLFHDPQELEKGVNLLLRQITDSFDASQAVPVSGEYRPSEVRLKPFFRHRNERTNICTCRSRPS
jgi:septin family protein